MNTEQALMERSNASCELCTATTGLSVYEVPPSSDGSADKCILLCATCIDQTEKPETADTNHWRCLNDSMWSQTPVVQVMAWRQLNQLSTESWAQDLLDMLYLDDELMAWAKAHETSEEAEEPTLDSNGATLQAGDTVTLIKDLVVKGAGFTAKRGTAVRNISLTPNNTQIEGRVNGTRIVLLTQYLKKSN